MSGGSSLARVDPELRAILAQLPNLSGLSDSTLAAMRARLTGTVQSLDADHSVEVRWIEVAGAPGAPAVPALLYRPRGALSAVPAILNIHGGGYVAGDAWRDHATMLSLAADLRCAVLSIDYRLAPENPYPAPLDDAETALAWLHGEAAAIGIDPERIAVRGVSAGGGLAAGLALRAARRGDLPIALLMLVYPMLDDRTGPIAGCGEHVWTASANAYGWASYLGSAADDPPDEAVPARTTEPALLPSTFLATGAIDLFAAENVALAGRLIAAGVATEFHVYPGAYHGFNLVPGARVADAFARDCRAALSRAFEKEEA